MHLAASRGMALSLLLTVAVGLSQSDIRAQQTAPADTVNPHRAQPERPTVATHAGTVAPGWVEMEMGGQRSDGNDRLSVQAPVVAKIGLASHMQLSVFGDWVSTSGHDARAEGVGDAAVGVKWRLVD